jgi:predicted amidophosphoribosyltransferase
VRGLRAPADVIDAPTGLDSLAAAPPYQGAGRRRIAGRKYRRPRGALGPLAAAMAARVEWRPDVVTWLPTTTARARRRGYDQAELLARAVAMRLGVPSRRLLARRSGPPQTGRALSDRLLGPELTGLRSAAGLVVLLVDDVVTSGASMTAGARALRQAGAREIHGIAAAHTPRTLGAPGTARSGPWKSP